MSPIRPLLITIDTEGDNLWARPRTITTRNATCLPRFQILCERFGFQPTWLVDHDMARDPFFIEFARDLVRRGAGEIGVHPHAWNTPPEHPLTSDDYRFMPYLIEYPASVLDAKLDALTDLLETTFAVKMVSHRAGRWSFNDAYARALVRRGFRVDCSVTPGVDWRTTLGDPQGEGGTDYSDASRDAFPLIAGDGAQQTLWEVPVTIRPAGGATAASVRRALGGSTLAGKLWNRLYPGARWFRPRPGNRRKMLRLLRAVVDEGSPYVEFMLHSSELMPGGSPNFPDERSIGLLWDDLEAVFAEARRLECVGMTLERYADHLDAARARLG
jgi:hypothetical protein